MPWFQFKLPDPNPGLLGQGPLLVFNSPRQPALAVSLLSCLTLLEAKKTVRLGETTSIIYWLAICQLWWGTHESRILEQTNCFWNQYNSKVTGRSEDCPPRHQKTPLKWSVGAPRWVTAIFRTADTVAGLHPRCPRCARFDRAPHIIHVAALICVDKEPDGRMWFSLSLLASTYY